MEPDYVELSDEEWDKAHALVSAWKNDPDMSHACPRCAAAGVSVQDHSVRPYAEWFEVDCASCGLHVAMHLPLAPTPGPSV